MAVMILDLDVEERLLAERESSDGSRYDEVWEGVYMMTPLPNDEHQEIVSSFSSILQEVIGWSRIAKVRAGVNLSDRAENWKQNYREPDVAVFMRDGKAINHGTHWQGAADFLVEIISPGERTREKIPFYSSLGVVELLVVDRDPWILELYRFQSGKLEEVGRSNPAAPDLLTSGTVGLTFRLLTTAGRLLTTASEARPQIEVTHPASGRCWIV